MLLKWILNRLGQHGQNCFDPGYGRVPGSCKHANEPSVSINWEEFLHQPGEILTSKERLCCSELLVYSALKITQFSTLRN